MRLSIREEKTKFSGLLDSFNELNLYVFVVHAAPFPGFVAWLLVIFLGLSLSGFEYNNKDATYRTVHAELCLT